MKMLYFDWWFFLLGQNLIICSSLIDWWSTWQMQRTAVFVIRLTLVQCDGIPICKSFKESIVHGPKSCCVEGLLDHWGKTAWYPAMPSLSFKVTLDVVMGFILSNSSLVLRTSTLKALLMFWSRGCRNDVVLDGRLITSILHALHSRIHSEPSLELWPSTSNNIFGALEHIYEHICSSDVSFLGASSSPLNHYVFQLWHYSDQSNHSWLTNVGLRFLQQIHLCQGAQTNFPLVVCPQQQNILDI